MTKPPKPHDVMVDRLKSEEDGRDDFSRFRTLVGLVPRDVCRRLIEKAQIAAMEAVADKIFFPDLDQSELDEFEAAMASEGIPEDVVREMAKFKEFIEAHHGKKFRDLPDATFEENEKYFRELVDELADTLVMQWRSLLLQAHHRHGSKEMLLDEQLLPTHPLDERHCNFATWLEILANGIRCFIEEDDACELQTAFADVLKAEISGSDSGMEISENYRIYLDEGGYRLK